MGWGGYRNEPAVRPDLCPVVRPAGRPAGRTAGTYQDGGPLAGRCRPKMGKILRGGLGRPDRRRVFRPRTAAEPHRRFIPMSTHNYSSHLVEDRHIQAQKLSFASEYISFSDGACPTHKGANSAGIRRPQRYVSIQETTHTPKPQCQATPVFPQKANAWNCCAPPILNIW